MKFQLPLPSDFSLPATVISHGFYQTLPFAWDGQKLSRIDRLKPEGRPHRLTITAEKDHLAVDIAGARNMPETYRVRLSRMLGLAKDLAPFFGVVQREPRLRWIAEQKAGRILRGGDLFEDVLKALAGTNTTWPQAVKVINRIATLGPKVGEDHAFPSAEEVIQAGASWLREEARAGYRADAMVAWAESWRSGEFDGETLENTAHQMSGDQVRKKFQSIRGIGPATASYLAAFLGKHDHVMVDSGVTAYAERRWGKKLTPKEITTHYAAYGEWRGLVSWFEMVGDWAERTKITPKS